MKKLFLILILISAVFTGLFAAESSSQTADDGWSTFSYENIPVLKVMESREGYVIIYQKNKVGIGSTVIPKTWAKGTPDNPRKLKIRKLEPGVVKPFMTIIKKEGNFHRVYLTIPMNKSDALWGSVKEITEGLDKENLDDVTL